MRLELTDLDETSLLADVKALLASEPCAIMPSDMPHVDSSPQDADPDSADSSESDKNSPIQTQEANKRRLYRERRKKERQSLQHQEAELSQELVRIHRAREDERTRVNANRAPSYFMWKAIAMQQLERRLHSEAEQKRLATVVGAQATYIQTLNGVEGRATRGLEDVICHVKRQRVEDTEGAMCNAYIRQLETNYKQIDEVFDECDLLHLHEMEATVRSVHRKASNGEVEYFQRLNKYVEPFSLHETATSLWDLGGKKFRGRGQHEHYAAVPDPQNTVAMKFRETCELETGAIVSFLHWHVVRRWFELDRIVIVCKLITNGEGIFSGMCLEETGWISLRQSTKVDEPGTQIEICIRQVPMHFKSSIAHDKNTAKQFHDMMQNTSDGITTEVMNSLENLLLEDTLDGLSN